MSSLASRDHFAERRPAGLSSKGHSKRRARRQRTGPAATLGHARSAVRRCDHAALLAAPATVASARKRGARARDGSGVRSGARQLRTRSRRRDALRNAHLVAGPRHGAALLAAGAGGAAALSAARCVAARVGFFARNGGTRAGDALVRADAGAVGDAAAMLGAAASRAAAGAGRSGGATASAHAADAARSRRTTRAARSRRTARTAAASAVLLIAGWTLAAARTAAVEWVGGAAEAVARVARREPREPERAQDTIRTTPVHYRPGL